jgi:hypothetical protein
MTYMATRHYWHRNDAPSDYRMPEEATLDALGKIVLVQDFRDTARVPRTDPMVSIGGTVGQSTVLDEAGARAVRDLLTRWLEGKNT